jgi:hypothetical protein
MMWGRGKSNGRMRDAFLTTLAAPDLADVLARTGSAAAEGDSEAAYRGWTITRGIRSAFFTKWLWVAGTRTPTLDTPPLILDSLVWKSLGTLGWRSLEAAGGNRSWAVRYAAYTQAASEWARLASKQCGQYVSPEAIEMALFTCAGDFTKLDR